MGCARKTAGAGKFKVKGRAGTRRVPVEQPAEDEFSEGVEAL